VGERLPRGVPVVGASESIQQAAMAAALYAGDQALVSFGTAGVLWGLLGARAHDVELWVPGAKKIDVPGLTIHRGTRLDRADRTTLGPIPITTAARTLIDLSARMEDAPLLATVEDAIRRSLVKPERLVARAEALRTSGRPGAGEARRAPRRSQRTCARVGARSQGVAVAEAVVAPAPAASALGGARRSPLPPRLRVARAPRRNRVRRMGAPRASVGVRARSCSSR